jgi:hypothetical protein
MLRTRLSIQRSLYTMTVWARIQIDKSPYYCFSFTCRDTAHELPYFILICFVTIIRSLSQGLLILLNFLTKKVGIICTKPVTKLSRYVCKYTLYFYLAITETK